MNINNNFIISLIIPVYNVEDYLIKALKSVENQSFKNFEVIIINDGSTDKSLDIINIFVKNNNNFILINQKNAGLSAARNAGIQASKGEYIAFMDSDDFIEINFLEDLYNNIIKNNADIACCNFNIYYPEQDLKIYMPFNSFPGVYNNVRSLKKLILDIGTRYFAWNKLYKKSLFIDNNIKFYNMYFEDIATSPRLFYYSKKIVFSSKALYNYTNRKNSILNTMNEIKINDFMLAFGSIRNFLEIKNNYLEYKNYIWAYSQKVKIICYYYVFNLHSKYNNFDGFKQNISNSTRSIDYFAGNKFKASTSGVAKLLYSVTAPKIKIKIKKTVNNNKK